MEDKNNRWLGLIFIATILVAGWCLRTAKEHYVLAKTAVDSLGAARGMASYVEHVQQDTEMLLEQSLTSLQLPDAGVEAQKEERPTTAPGKQQHNLLYAAERRLEVQQHK